MPEDGPSTRPAACATQDQGGLGAGPHWHPQPDGGPPWQPVPRPPEVPQPDGLLAPTADLLQGSFIVLVPDYCPEHCQLLLQPPCALDHVLRELKLARHPLRQRRFPYVLWPCDTR